MADENPENSSEVEQADQPDVWVLYDGRGSHETSTEDVIYHE